MVGEASGEEQLFSSENSLMRDGSGCELDVYLEKIKVCSSLFLSVSSSPLFGLYYNFHFSFLKQAWFYTFLFCLLISLPDSDLDLISDSFQFPLLLCSSLIQDIYMSGLLGQECPQDPDN